MPVAKLILLILLGAFTGKSASSQNALINILTQKSGVVSKGGTVFLEVTLTNTDFATAIGSYKIKTQISVPTTIASISTTGHVLPTDWAILSNDGSTIILSNGNDFISPESSRTILIAIQGTKIGGPSTIIGQLSFSNGISPGTAPGSLPDDNQADNSSTTTIKVIK